MRVFGVSELNILSNSTYLTSKGAPEAVYSIHRGAWQ